MELPQQNIPRDKSCKRNYGGGKIQQFLAMCYGTAKNLSVKAVFPKPYLA